MSSFEKLAAINVNDKVEKKNKFSYLSWAWAVDKLLREDPTANWTYANPVTFPDGTMMVACTVTAFGIGRQMQLPVINHANKPIANPNAFDINTSMQRCLVKAIALHGLGLYLYAGEDLPPESEGQNWEKWMADNAIPVQDDLNAGNVSGARDKYEAAFEQLPDEQTQTQFHFLFNAADRASLKKEGKRRRDEIELAAQQAAKDLEKP